MAVLPTPGSPMSTGLFLVRARQHLDAAADLLVAADDRVDLAARGERGEVLAVLLERGELLLRALVGDAVRAADILEGAEQFLGADVEAGVHREQQVLDRQEIVAEVLAVRLGVLDDVGEFLAHPRLGTAVRLGELLDGIVGTVADHQRRLAELGEHCRHDRAVLAHHRAEHVIGVSSGFDSSLAWSMAAENASWVFSVHFFGSMAMSCSSGLPGVELTQQC